MAKEYTFHDSKKLIAFLAELSSKKCYVFRGYGKQSELLPNIIRDKDWRDQEIKLLNEFERYGLQYFSANNPIDFMSYGQHYGLPTRLLDFTYNPFIALSFALFVSKGTKYTCEEDKVYYYIRYSKIEDQNYFRMLPYYDEDHLFRSSLFALQCRNMVGLLERIIRGLKEPADPERTGEKAILSYFRKIYREAHPELANIDVSDFRVFIQDAIAKFEDKKILFVDANQCSQRIVMQQGLFMFPYTLDKEEHLEIIKNNSVLIKIHKDIRDELLEYLESMGITSYRLMPDLQSVCAAAKRKITEQRQSQSELFKRKVNLDEVHTILKEAYKENCRAHCYDFRKAQNASIFRITCLPLSGSILLDFCIFYDIFGQSLGLVDLLHSYTKAFANGCQICMDRSSFIFLSHQMIGIFLDQGLLGITIASDIRHSLYAKIGGPVRKNADVMFVRADGFIVCEFSLQVFAYHIPARYMYVLRNSPHRLKFRFCMFLPYMCVRNNTLNHIAYPDCSHF